MTVTLHVVTGILGSGKTTFVRHMIEGKGIESRPGVVVGEYAEEGYDGALIRASGATVRQITATGRGDTVKSYADPVRELVMSKNHHRVYVETSGVAAIRAIAKELATDPEIAANARFGRSVTVLDAAAFALHDKHFGEQLWSQVGIADLVVVNKTDRVTEAELAEVRDRLKARVPQTPVQFSYMGQIRRDEMVGLLPEDFSPRILEDWDAADEPAEFEAFVYRSKLPCYDRVMFGHKLLNLPGGRIARFKGGLRCWDKVHGLNGFPGQMDWDVTAPEARDTAIAFIGLDLTARKAEICGILDAELAGQQDDGR